MEVLRLISMGRGNDAIAANLHRSRRAVEWHICRLYEDLHCTQRIELFRYGLQAGLPDIEESYWTQMLDQVARTTPALPVLK
jgi:DNA-binding NarL/FixJ family response regulator